MDFGCILFQSTNQIKNILMEGWNYEYTCECPNEMKNILINKWNDEYIKN